MIATTTAARIAHDEATAKAWNDRYAAEGRVVSAMSGIHYAAGDKKVYGWGRGQRHGVWQMTFSEALTKVEAAVTMPVEEAYEAFSALDWDTDRDAKMAAHKVWTAAKEGQDALDRLVAARQALAVIEATIEDLETSYTGWTRAYLVTNSNGHIHSSMACSTCNRGNDATQFAWVTDFSDHNEAEIVAAAGWRACSVCYPTAPVVGMTAKAAKAALPSTIKNDGSIKA